MIGKRSRSSVYRELLVSRDFILWLGAVVFLGLSLMLQKSSLGNPVLGPLRLSSWSALASVLINGAPIVWGAVKGIWRRQVNVDELVSVAILACLATGEYLEAAIVCAIMVLGELVEEAVSQGARNSISSLIRLSPKTASALREDGSEEEVEVASLKPGELICLRPGDTLAVDGEIVKGGASIDESSLTGESLPVSRGPGDVLSSGTLNLDGHIVLRVLRGGQDSTLARVISLIQAAEASKVRGTRLVDRYSKWFSPTILILAALAWLVTKDIHHAITVLIVGCPCSFLLSGPVPTVAAIGRAARSGILVKDGLALESLSRSRSWFFDKTGTLTRGEPRLCGLRALGPWDVDLALAWAAAVERGSEHPLGRAIVAHAQSRGLSSPEASDIRANPGYGISGSVEGHRVELISDQGPEGDGPEGDGSQGNGSQGDGSQGNGDEQRASLVLMKVDGQDALRLSFQDEARPEAKEGIEGLKALGIVDLRVLSGDRSAPVEAIARGLGLKAAESGLSPAQKLDRLRQAAGPGAGQCVFVGDGLNDAPALTAADVGIAMGGRGVDAALDTADIVLLNDNIALLPFLLRLARRMESIIRVNIALSLGINALALALAFYGILTPILGAISHNLGSIAVVTISASMVFMREKGRVGHGRGREGKDGRRPAVG